MNDLSHSTSKLKLYLQNYFSLLKVPKNWNNNCPFYNRIALKSLVENYLASKDKTCMRLGMYFTS